MDSGDRSLGKRAKPNRHAKTDTEQYGGAAQVLGAFGQIMKVGPDPVNRRFDA
jgi:hypothetical protein